MSWVYCSNTNAILELFLGPINQSFIYFSRQQPGVVKHSVRSKKAIASRFTSDLARDRKQ